MEGLSKKRKRTHGHGQQRCGDCWGRGDIRGLKGNVKEKYNKDFKKIDFISF